VSLLLWKLAEKLAFQDISAALVKLEFNVNLFVDVLPN
jgi:hypothetical protein